MKPSEIIKLDEGPIDWMKRSGLLGKEQQISAIGSQLDRTQAAMQSSAEKSLEASRQRQFQKLLLDLPVAIARAYQSSVVAESAFRKNNYNKFNRLIESLILNESMNMEQFVKQYMANLAGNLKIPPPIQSTIDKHIATFVTQFTYDPSKKPEEHKLDAAATKTVTDIWDAMQSARKVQGATPASSLATGYGLPKADTTIDIQGNEYKFTSSPTDKKWRNEAGEEITDPADIQQLNKAAYIASKQKLSAVAPPTADTTVTYRGKVFKFTLADGKWRDDTGTEVGLIKPESIDKLNREAADAII